MSRTSCNKLAEWLADFADGALEGARQQQVADHVAECGRCAEQVRLFQRSLELARDVWRHDSEDADSPYRRHRPWIRAVASVAAAWLVVALGWLAAGSLRSRSESPPHIGPQRQAATIQRTNDEVDMLTMVAAETRKARLATAVQFLSAEPAIADYRLKAEQYLEQTYGDVRANGTTRSGS